MEQEREASSPTEEVNPDELPQPPTELPPKRPRGRPKKQIVAEPAEQDEAEIEVLSARPTRPKRAAALRARPSSPPQPSGSSAQPSTTEVGGPKATMLLFRDLLGDEHFLGPAFVTATLDFLRDLVGMHQEEVHRRLATWYPVIETHLSKTRKHPDRLFIRRSTRAFETEELQNFYETVTRRGDEPFLFDCGTIQSERAWLPNVGRLLGRLQKWEDTDIVKALMEEE